MTQQKPEWFTQFYTKGTGPKLREGIRLIEYSTDWHMHPHMHPGRSGRLIYQWGPFKTKTNRGHKKWARAVLACNELRSKLEKAWPCTFLVKGYNYKPPRVTGDDNADRQDQMAQDKATNCG